MVDGNWVTDHTAAKEVDESGNENNVLTPDRIIAEAPATAAIMSSVTPDSTTAALAAGVPLEKKPESEELPGKFPETPAASAEAEKGGEFSVNPLPATAGAVNPITLAPGEKIPENLAAAAPTDNVKLDPESYEKSDSLPGKPNCLRLLTCHVSVLTYSHVRWRSRRVVFCCTGIYDCRTSG